MTLLNDPIELFLIGVGLALVGTSTVVGQKLASRLRAGYAHATPTREAMMKSTRGFRIGLFLWVTFAVGCFLWHRDFLSATLIVSILAIYVPPWWVLYRVQPNNDT
jgi:hypothetical protein